MTGIGGQTGHVLSFDATVLTLETRGPADAPLLVLVHGLGLSMRSWGGLPDLLADEHRVVGYDLRGHGRSGSAPSGDYSLTAHARDLGAVLSHLAPQGPAVLVANSLGGGIVLEHAHASGVDGVAGVVFAGSGGSGVTVPGLPARGVPSVARRLLRRGWLRVLRSAAVLSRHLRTVEPVANRLVRSFAFEPGAPEEAVDRVREDFMSSRRTALARTTLASVSHDGPRYAPELEVPTLVLHGDQDPEVPQDELDRLLPRLPDAEVVQLAGAGHMLALTRTEQTAEHVRRWVRQVRAASRRADGPGHATRSG